MEDIAFVIELEPLLKPVEKAVLDWIIRELPLPVTVVVLQAVEAALPIAPCSLPPEVARTVTPLPDSSTVTVSEAVAC